MYTTKYWDACIRFNIYKSVKKKNSKYSVQQQMYNNLLYAEKVYGLGVPRSLIKGMRYIILF